MIYITKTNMKNKKYKTQKRIREKQVKLWHCAIILGALALSTSLIVFYTLLLDNNVQYAQIEHNKRYAYNERVPVEVVKAEIVKQANIYGVDPDNALALAFCESGYNNLARNKQGSSATGLYQFIYSTWKATESGKNHISPYEYKANIKEAMLKVQQGKTKQEWKDCFAQLGL